MSKGGYFFQNIGNEVKDPRWTTVDTYLLSHSNPPSQPNTGALQHTLTASASAGLPDLAVSPHQAKFMALVCRMMNVSHALEVGTLGGYGAIWLASCNPQLQVTTVEHDAYYASVARSNLEHAGLSSQIDGHHGEVLGGTRPRFGFVFIDADKENSWNYFDLAAGMTKPRAAICVDNVVRDGRVIDATNSHPHIQGGRLVIENAGKDPRVDSAVIQTVGEKGYDGFLWSVLK
ncbi:S-adenosyl-L-methionine-dependent methyltransferase [Podospora didyma]|uniref:S-adenosyl-L-methionine-dependent methyltransferase n=1 Tax=Podospora didyma TaxID=330526 RepID=A0AAE0N597_9PEZI|nr:S-adenosyl-L-methionine-dependent methyltransferase [Podospora didyma]